MAAVLVWLELGLSVPKFEVPDGDTAGSPPEHHSTLRSVPRNGGEKNYLEYIYKSPKIRTTCMYGVIYVILGNLSGNAIAFGIYIMEVSCCLRCFWGLGSQYVTLSFNDLGKLEVQQPRASPASVFG